MRLLAGGVILAAGAAYLFLRQHPANVYPVPVATAYETLSTIKFEPPDDGATANEISGNGVDKVIWIEKGDLASYRCDLKLAALPRDAGQTHVTVTCSGGGDGPAAGLAKMHRNAVIEHVDAALSGRPFDAARADITAYRWPGNGSIGTAAGQAPKTGAEVRKGARETQGPPATS
ncbi:hypothetical protein [Sphingomonas alpina]|uniref:Uncharacterized protein n=1 Tax=Sphingomonas alpina TaxID=653931 RepID=A0A7H0LJQ1_9SPHN|nr:hypothetical protein [Sphingomonas alpina]QNQ09904.1 hypothetical protein H3Z74_01200 [Sphingomonas alpina]